MLSDKIVVFTTHKLSLLTDLEHIVQMRDGSVFNQGQYRDIIHPDGSGNFQEISLAKEGREYNEIRTSPSVSILRERKMTNEDSIRYKSKMNAYKLFKVSYCKE